MEKGLDVIYICAETNDDTRLVTGLHVVATMQEWRSCPTGYMIETRDGNLPEADDDGNQLFASASGFLLTVWTAKRNPPGTPLRE